MTIRTLFLPLALLFAVGCYDKEDSSATGADVEA